MTAKASRIRATGSARVIQAANIEACHMWLHECIIEETSDLIRVVDARHDFTFEMYGMAPVQAFGEIGGRDFYFRARHTDWWCEVSDSKGQLPSDGRAAPDGFIREGKYKNASYMPLRDALKIIDGCMAEYLASFDVDPVQQDDD